jgi:hypothetical protein
MSVIAHFETLNQRHARLEATIENAYASHLSDEVISELKKQKLLLKEEIHLLNQKMIQDGIMLQKTAA